MGGRTLGSVCLRSSDSDVEDLGPWSCEVSPGPEGQGRTSKGSRPSRVSLQTPTLSLHLGSTERGGLGSPTFVVYAVVSVRCVAPPKH